MKNVPGADKLDLFGPAEDWDWALRLTERAVWDFPEWERVRDLIEGMSEEEFQSLRESKSKDTI
jgi:hypothetical protein